MKRFKEFLEEDVSNIKLNPSKYYTFDDLAKYTDQQLKDFSNNPKERLGFVADRWAEIKKGTDFRAFFTNISLDRTKKLIILSDDNYNQAIYATRVIYLKKG